MVLVHLGHRLVQMSLRLLRAQIWATEDGRKGLKRVSIRSLPDDRLPEPMAIVISRLVIVGGNHHRLHEELTESGGYLTERGFRRETGVTEIRNFLADASPVRVADHIAEDLAARFEAVREQVMDTVNARSRDRLRNLSNTIETRRKTEIRDMERVLDELERSLKEEIRKDMEPQQLSLFSEDERLQVTRDRAALEARLARIPEEREAEIPGD